ncbi:molybdate ABC transporter permease subunit [Nanchangia anserum]|uniref:Molybdate ABC transporter permease subunit n=1 Tax=Nanchangia anserum TaxID=2692125 RepID=A0A8I0GFG5_9ACTO|nr:ABC transporter permease [Nanchangia anserum]MBD3689059.1 molybdate ABC transporter permease subunit [Nanchangia anserum]QOX81300.1 molybdate ABC transporter permease subunit [Nanchangia anserum]
MTTATKPPAAAYAPAAVALAFLLVPFLALAWRIDWPQLPALVAAPASRDALWLSVWTCTVSTLICLIFGVPLALILARSRTGAASHVVRVLVTVPMVLPPVVAGVALLITWGRRGLLGRHLEVWGIEIGFTTLAVILAQVFVALPFAVTSLEAALRARGFALEAAAARLGASPIRIAATITAPLAAPAIATAAALAFARCLGEFGATIAFAGSLQGVTRTLPLEIYLQRETDTDRALALAAVLIALAVVLVGGTQWASARWYRRLTEGGEPADERAGEAAEVPVRGGEAGPPVRVRAVVPERGVSIDVEFPAARTTAVIGPNGAGKSTLLHVAAGEVEGELRGRVAVLDQHPALFPHMSVLDNVAFARRVRGDAPEAARGRAEEELARLGIAHLRHRRPATLSGGQAQRVALARALVTDPVVALLDEPTAALDADAAADFRTLVARRLAGATVVFVTHDLADVAELDAHVVALREGELAWEGEWDDLAESADPIVRRQLTRYALSHAATRRCGPRPCR